MNRLVWAGHPYGGDPANLARAKRWLRWLLRTFPHHDFVADWILWCEVLNDADPAERARGLRFDFRMIELCSEYWMVGGVISPGMAAERAAAVNAGCETVDLISLGAEPPAANDNQWPDLLPQHLRLIWKGGE